MSINKKLLQYAKFKGISQRKFTSSIGLAEGVLRRGKNIGSGWLKAIREKYPDLNMDWLLFDEGEMLISFEQKEESAKNREDTTDQIESIVDKKLKDLVQPYFLDYDKKLSAIQERLNEYPKNPSKS